MRMRAKKNLDEKIANVQEHLIFLRSDDLNFRTASLVKEYVDLEAIFGRQAPLHLEIGCGKGTFLSAVARRWPDRNFIGVELDRNVAYMAAKKLQDDGVTNAVVFGMKAEYLGKYLPDGCAERIYLNFSCPYPKSDYASHRLTSPGFLELYRSLMAPGARIWQKTDDAHFFEYSIASLSQAGFTLDNISLDLHASAYQGNIVTEYEQRWIDQGKPIYRLEAYLKEESPCDTKTTGQA